MFALYTFRQYSLSQLLVVRSEQVRTFFYHTESQETKSEVLSISDGADQELVIA